MSSSATGASVAPRPAVASAPSASRGAFRPPTSRLLDSTAAGGGGSTRSRGRMFRADSSEEDVEYDESKSARENLQEALRHLSTRSGVTKSKKLAYLNALAKLWERVDQEEEHGIRLKEVLLCLRIPLTHESAEVRAATLRTVRYLLAEERDAADVCKTNMHYLIARCLDIDLDNKVERIHALRLARKLLFLSPKQFPEAITRCLIAIAEGDNNEEDRLRRISLAVLCELSIFNSDVFMACNGVNTLTHTLLDCSMPRITEAIIGSLLRLHNNPLTRPLAKISLDVVVAPFTEFRYVHDDPQGPLSSEAGGGVGGASNDRELRFQCGRQAVLSLLRSWTGLLHLADPRRRHGAPSPLKALVDILYLPNARVREHVIGLLFEVLSLRLPKETDHFGEALESADPSHFRDSWKLAEGFVATEGWHIIPSMIKSRPNLQETHRSLLLYCLLKTELPEALVRVIVTAEIEQAIQATVLLGEFLHLTYVLLPRELNATSHCLPSLLSFVQTVMPRSPEQLARSNCATQAVLALQTLHSIKKLGPMAHSLFLEQIMSSSGHFQQSEVGERLNSPAKWGQIFSKSINERVASSVQESRVLVSGDATAWNWDLVAAVFKWPGETFSALDTNVNRQFVRKVADYFKPTNNGFAKLELSNKQSKCLAKTGCCMIDFFLKTNTLEANRILEELISDIKNQFSLLISTTSAHDCLLSPTRVASTACQYYFLFLGRMSRSPDGRRVLDKHSILQSMFELLSLRSDMYLKLVITSLDYGSVDWGSRNLLGKACREASEPCRLYSTRFLGVLIRSRTPNITQWALDLLVNQLFDKSKIIPWVALEILDEACDDKMNLEAAVCAVCALAPHKEPGLRHLGFRGVLLFAHFIASANGFKFLVQTNLLAEQLSQWAVEYNVRYVFVVEELINDGFTRHQRNEERSYGRRSHEAHAMRDCFLPPHIYGQLAATAEGMQLLLAEKTLYGMFQLLRDVCKDEAVLDEDLVRVKAAIWAVCNIARSPEGALLCTKEGAISNVIGFAETSPYYSLRGTSFYALSLVAMTKHGTKVLESYGWFSVKNSKDEKWPVQEDWVTSRLAILQVEWEQSAGMQSDGGASEQADLPTAKSESKKQQGEVMVDSTEENIQNSSSSLSDRTSIFRRKRFSKMFRSFSLGTSGERKKSSGGRIRRNIFRNPSFNQDDDDNDDGAAASSATQSNTSRQQQQVTSTPRKELDESVSSGSTERSAPIALPEDFLAIPPAAEPPPPPMLTNIDEETPSANLDELAAANIKLNDDEEQRSFTDSTSGISSEGSLHLPKVNYFIIDQTHPKLSPIASATSISTMKSPLNLQPAAEVGVAAAALLKFEALGTRFPVRRTGQRAYSESEAHNLVKGESANATTRHRGGQYNHHHSQMSAHAVYHYQGNSISSVASSSMGSWTDNPGYHTLRNIHNRRRPPLLLSESGEAAEVAAELLGSSTSSVLRPYARSDTWSRKTRSLDYRLTRTQRGYSTLPSRTGGGGSATGHLRRQRAMLPLVEKETSDGPEVTFWGITLPMSIEILFPVETFDNHVPEETSPPRSKDTQLVAEWLQSHHLQADGLSTFHGLELHTAGTCLACYRMISPSASGNSPDRRRSGSVSHQGIGAAMDPGDLERISTSGQCSPIALRRLRKESLVGSADSFGGGSTQSLKSESDLRITSADSILGKIVQRSDVLRLIGSMNATVGVKTAEQGLLKLKQKNPNIFQDLCLYSEVCLLLTKYQFRLSARRFIQELFMSLQYDELYLEPYKILGLEDSPSHLSQLAEIASDETLFQSSSSGKNKHHSVVA